MIPDGSRNPQRAFVSARREMRAVWSACGSYSVVRVKLVREAMRGWSETKGIDFEVSVAYTWSRTCRIRLSSRVIITNVVHNLGVSIIVR